jgi:hypothetical protein
MVDLGSTNRLSAERSVGSVCRARRGFIVASPKGGQLGTGLYAAPLDLAAPLPFPVWQTPTPRLVDCVPDGARADRTSAGQNISVLSG